MIEGPLMIKSTAMACLAQRWLTACVAVLLLSGCSRAQESSQMDPEARTPQAHPPLPAYAWAPDSQVAFRLTARGVNLEGTVRGVRGNITIDPADLSRTRGFVELDLDTLEIFELHPDGSRGTSHAREAKAWLGLGATAPNHEKLRFARFDLLRIDRPSARSPAEGQPVARKASFTGDPKLHAPSTAASAPEVETLRVRGTAIGELTLHGFRIARSVELELHFSYRAPRGPSSQAFEVTVAQSKPFWLALAAHEIEPRTAEGALDAEKSAEVGKSFPAEVPLALQLRAVLISR
jgi:hypothetical protein